MSITKRRRHELYTRLSVVHVEIKVKRPRVLNAMYRIFDNMSVNDLFQPIEESVGGSGDVDGVTIGVGVGVAILVILVVAVVVVVVLLRKTGRWIITDTYL